METKPLLKPEDGNDDVADSRRHKDDPLCLEVQLGTCCTRARIIFVAVILFIIGFCAALYIEPLIDMACWDLFFGKTSASRVLLNTLAVPI